MSNTVLTGFRTLLLSTFVHSSHNTLPLDPGPSVDMQRDQRADFSLGLEG